MAQSISGALENVYASLDPVNGKENVYTISADCVSMCNYVRGAYATIMVGMLQ